ncbi:uncharacterized protein LOC135815626 [Sycon ciliatum]|uniref:uncharacterized protein LOC135815626 n=1 Tax=Sycon ciliatum TaxID=27933 RepID=UPI0031F71C58
MDDSTSRGKTARSSPELDLYGDLVNGGTVNQDPEALSRQLEEQKARYADLDVKYRECSEDSVRYQTTAAELTKRNSALQMNISCLYKTAKLEIDRKDREILSLRARLEALSKVASDLKASNDAAGLHMQQLEAQVTSLRSMPQLNEPDVQPATPAYDMAVDSSDDRPITPARHEMTPENYRHRAMTESSDWSSCSSPKGVPDALPFASKIQSE